MSDLSGRAILSLGIAALALTAGCAASSESTPPTETSLTRSLLESGVGIIAEGCSLVAQIGSGVVLGEPGQVVTVAHTIKGANIVTVIDHTGAEHTAAVRAFDKDSDLAVLEVADLRVPALELGAVQLGDGGALTWGREEGVEFLPVKVSRRLLVTIEDIYIEDTIQRDAVEVVADIQNGDSGGPILSASGSVIGIIYANSRQRDGLGFASDTSEIQSVLDSKSDTTVPSGSCFGP